MKRKLHISDGNTKLGGIPSVSLDPHLTCKPEWPCYRSCYARRIAAFRKNVRQCWVDNTAFFAHDRKGYEQEIMAYLSRKEPTYFRWHVGGEIIDQRHVGMVKRVAQRTPGTRFLIYTRRNDLRWGRLPDNLKVFFSFWQQPGERKPINSGYPRAIIGDTPDKDSHVCPGKCPECMFCYTDRSSKNVHFKPH